MSHRGRLFAFLGLLALVPLGRAEAAIISYTSSAAFLAAAGGSVVTETYEGLAVGTIILDGTTVNGISYDSFPAGKDGRIDNLYNRIGTRSLAAAPPASGFFIAGESVTVSFPFAVDAVGIFFNVASSPLNTLQVQTAAGTAGNGAAYDVTTLYFVGLISDVPFASATFAGLPGIASGFNLDNLSYRAAVPEPTGLAFLGLGIAAIVRARARRVR